jgi:hypothetical protein
MPTQEPGTARRPSGPCEVGAVTRPGGHVLRAALRGVPRRCAHKRLRVRVVVEHSAPLRFVHVRVNGRLVHSGARARFTLTVHGRSGRNRITLNAVDVRGLRVVASARFERC